MVECKEAAVSQSDDVINNAHDDRPTKRKGEEVDWEVKSQHVVPDVRENYSANHSLIPDDATIDLLSTKLILWRDVAKQLDVTIDENYSNPIRQLVEVYASRCERCDWSKFVSVLDELNEGSAARILSDWLSNETRVKLPAPHIQQSHASQAETFLV